VLDDLYRFMNIIEILLDENSKLAQHLEKKNVDMGKLI
jgi:hypothetical protein